MSTRIFLAGAEVPKFKDCMIEMKSKSLLMTYWSVRKNPGYVKQVKEANPEIDIIIDSGAFSFFEMAEKQADADGNLHIMPIGFYAKYMKEYLGFLHKYSKYIYAAADLDIDKLIGSTAEKWREKYFEPLNKSVLKVMFVWHDGHHTMEDWKRYCSKYDFVAIGRSFSGVDVQYQNLMNMARPYLTKVHALGYTQSTQLHKYDFYSCDSSTWLLGSKYGETDVFNGKTISRYDNSKKQSIRMRFRTKFENAGLKWSKIAQEEYYEVIKMNMLAFIEMEEYLSRANRLKAYWNKKLPRPGIVSDKKTDAEITELLGTQGWAEEDFAAITEPDDRRERCEVFSRLQWGHMKWIRRWLSENTLEDIAGILPEMAVKKLKNKDDPTDDELDNLRRYYNLSLLGMVKPKDRIQPEDFEPAFKLSRRDEEETTVTEKELWERFQREVPEMNYFE